MLRTIVARGGSADESIALLKRFAGAIEHLFGGNNRHDRRPSRVLDFDRSAHDNHFMPQFQGRLSQRHPHATTRRVRQIAHRIKVLPRRA